MMIDCAQTDGVEDHDTRVRSIELYLPEKYQVILGNPASCLALCTCWSDPKILVKTYPGLLEKFSVIGSLYSPGGVSILLRNLALNPQIQQVLVWANSPLSKTAIGKTGSTALFSLFEKGIEDDFTIRGKSTQIHHQIDLETARRIVEDVMLKDVSLLTVSEIISLNLVQEDVSRLTSQRAFPRRFSQSFPIAQRETSAPFPSERQGWVIHTKKVVDAWLGVVERIMRYGHVEPTQYGSQQKALRTMQWVIENTQDFTLPQGLSPLREKLGLSKGSLEEYSSYFLDPVVHAGISYTYGGRLCGYRHGTLNQIDEIIRKLKQDPHTRRAVAVTLDPELDATSTSPPCLNHLQVVVDSKVHLIALFRSHDIFKAGLMNAFGLCGVVRYIAEQLGKEMGSLTIISNIAHIYEEDWSDASQLVACQVEGMLVTRFNEHTDIDQRGLVRIGIEGGKLHLSLVSYQGEELWYFVGTSARELVMNLAKRNLLSRADHYCDITLEAVKAELALKAGVEYVQDRPVRIEGIVVS